LIHICISAFSLRHDNLCKKKIKSHVDGGYERERGSSYAKLAAGEKQDDESN
jgi:hypothetical protein